MATQETKDWNPVQLGLLGLPRSASSPGGEPNIQELFPEIVAKSDGMIQVLKNVCKISKSSSSVLILGESGTGKELIASAIHRLSPRVRAPFLAINCSAIPEDLLEAELFGHEKGAFTGADKKRTGYFGSAHQGTIFLDEIGDMPQRLQAKLLRVLQEKKFSPLGSSDVKEVDVRVIAATHVDLEEAVKNQKFRLDLYYRLNVLPVVLPALRNRVEDIPYLLDHFLERTNLRQQLENPCWFDEGVLGVFRRFAWPGNVRHLENMIERLVTLKGGGCITLSDLPVELMAAPPDHTPPPSSLGRVDLPQAGFDLTLYIETLENNYIKEALRRTHNNKNKAAQLLGINRTTLVERLKRRGLSIVFDRTS
jgi:transcriptional regulator with PAS, ATPase and Fis domain